MQITLAAIADYASVSIGDKLNVMGVFDTIAAPQFPAVHPQLFLAVRLQFEFEDRNAEVSLQIRLEDEDGKVSLRANPKGRIGAVQPGETGNVNFVLGLANLRFDGPGRYSVVVSLGGQDDVRLPLRIMQQAR